MSIVRNAIVVGASSDIGAALCMDWLAKGIQVSGTYRRRTPTVTDIETASAPLVYADVTSKDSIENACRFLVSNTSPWDVLVLAPAAQEPIGLFGECDFDEWERSIELNYTSQLRFVHRLLAHRNTATTSTILFFAGGGTNDAPKRYSAYITAKIALQKMCELLAAEYPQISFVIVGPGWVKTKIHESTLKAGELAGANYQRTVDKLESSECTPMENVVDCCNWLISAPLEAVTGRNFSVVFDKWGSEKLVQTLSQNSNLYKLRRSGNELNIS